MAFFNTKDVGPIVIDVPPAGDHGSLNANIVNIWQEPLEDAGGIQRQRRAGADHHQQQHQPQPIADVDGRRERQRRDRHGGSPGIVGRSWPSGGHRGCEQGSGRRGQG